MLKVAHTLDVRSFHAAELALPGVERGTADTVLTTYVLPGEGLPEVSSFGLHYFKGGVHRSPY